MKLLWMRKDGWTRDTIVFATFYLIFNFFGDLFSLWSFNQLCKLDWILGSKQYFRSYGFFPSYSHFYMLSSGFLLIGLLDLVYWTSLDILRLKNFWRLFWSLDFLFPKDRGFLFPSQNFQFLCIIKRLKMLVAQLNQFQM